MKIVHYIASTLFILLAAFSLIGIWAFENFYAVAAFGLAGLFILGELAKMSKKKPLIPPVASVSMTVEQYMQLKGDLTKIDIKDLSYIGEETSLLEAGRIIRFESNYFGLSKQHLVEFEKYPPTSIYGKDLKITDVDMKLHKRHLNKEYNG